jgi:hypothetical protein
MTQMYAPTEKYAHLALLIYKQADLPDILKHPLLKKYCNFGEYQARIAYCMFLHVGDGFIPTKEERGKVFGHSGFVRCLGSGGVGAFQPWGMSTVFFLSSFFVHTLEISCFPSFKGAGQRDGSG